MDAPPKAAQPQPPGLAAVPRERADEADPAAAVAALYEDHAVSLIRLAHVMLGNRAAAEDVVQDAFCGLYRRWAKLTDKDRALGYLRVSVLNGCRSALRRTPVTWELTDSVEPRPASSAETAAISVEQRHEVARALRCLPHRQREVLVLRFYLDWSDAQIARETGIRPTSIRSARHRGLAALVNVLPAVHVYDTATGGERTWPGEAYALVGPAPLPSTLSWTADSRTLALIGNPSHPRVLLIDTDARPGTGVISRTGIAFLRQTAENWVEMIVTPDGRGVLVLSVYASKGRYIQRLEEDSLRTGRRTQVLAVTPLPRGGPFLQVLWSNPTGRTLVVASEPRQRVASIYAHGRFTVIPWSPRFITAAW